ncbi:channel-forming protein ArfA/OmpATb [Mycolicibacterium stellerae]|uniref:channel-forming protein ArfA/OmpATb n=1 Tax=Mycolicibacterium stellerae TaxID=2358193 RepID=UPI000F0B2F2E|nr:OmpA family protein [Mycolicibacterium stellerae]
MTGSDVSRTVTGNRTAAKFYRRPPGAAWLLALLAIPLLLAVIGWAGLKKPDAEASLVLPSINPSATLSINAPDVNAPTVDAPDLNFAPLSILRSGRGFTLWGELPDIATKNGLLDSLKLAFGPNIELTDNLNVKAGVNAPDFAALGSILGAAIDIPDFHVDLNGDTVTLEGTAPSEKSKSEVEAAVKAAWPKTKVVNEITVSAASTAPAAPAAPAPAPAPAPATAGGPCATLQADITALLKTPINFQTAGFSLTPASRQQLTQIADRLKACPDPKVAVVGHTDNSGNDAINIPLSNDRAKAVADYLVSQGVVADRVTSKGVGSAEPVAPNDTPSGKAQNRRVAITVS